MSKKTIFTSGNALLLHSGKEVSKSLLLILILWHKFEEEGWGCLKNSTTGHHSSNQNGGLLHGYILIITKTQRRVDAWKQ